MSFVRLNYSQLSITNVVTLCLNLVYVRDVLAACSLQVHQLNFKMSSELDEATIFVIITPRFPDYNFSFSLTLTNVVNASAVAYKCKPGWTDRLIFVLQSGWRVCKRWKIVFKTTLSSLFKFLSERFYDLFHEALVKDYC